MAFMRVLYLAGAGFVAVALGAGLWLALAPSAPPAPERTPVARAPSPAELAPPGAAPAPPAAEPEALTFDARHAACLARAGAEPRAALREAERLAAAGAGSIAEHCAAAALLALGESAEAAMRLERLGLEGEAPSQVRAAWLAQAGQAWLMAGDAARSHAAATLALVLAPDDPDLLTDRAIAAATLGRVFEAIDDLNRVIDIDPARAEAFVFRAAAWRQAGRAELAADDLGRALGLDPGNPEAYLERGMLRAAARDFAAARGDFLRAAELAPGTPTEELARAQLEAITGR